MGGHRTISFELNVDKPGRVYRRILAMERVSSGHGDNIGYLLVHALVEWGDANSESPMPAFFIAMQYSAEPGMRVDVSQPAHILARDLPRVLAAFSEFCSNRGVKE